MPAALSARQRLLVMSLVTAVLTGLLIAAPAPQEARATPVNDTVTSYNACDRVFPDPQAYWPSPSQAPGQSPFAKGVGSCKAGEFITYQEMIDGNNFLEQLFPQFVEFYELEADFGDGDACATSTDVDDYCSAGLSQTGAPFPERERSDLYLLRITDERVPDTDKKFFAFPLSIHGIERAGVEGGTRAGEDLPTWAWCEAFANGENPQVLAGASPNCAQEGAIPHPVLETQPDSSLGAGEILKKSAVYFIYANADGWRRGDPGNVPRAYQRYNGNSVDMNRDWPTVGYTFQPYTPWSEPETKAFGKVLKEIKGKWDGGIDLHGQLDAPAFSFTMLGASQRDFGKNQRILQTVKGAWEDAEERLAWSALIKPNDAPADDPRLYGVQWGTVWDTINYTTTGSFGDWIDSPLGLGADGIDNEMTLSHIGNCGTGTCFLPDVEQLHIDGNKSLIYAMLNFTLQPEDTSFRAPGKVGYVFDPRRLSSPGNTQKTDQYAGLPQQDTINGTMNPANDFKFPFQVEGPGEGVYNGGLVGTVTALNAGGVSLNTTANTALVLERFIPHDQEGDEITQSTPDDNGCAADGDKWIEMNRYFNQNQLYASNGAAVHANYPPAGPWRACMTGDIPDQIGGTGFATVEIDFLPEEAWEDPGQLPYDVSNMDFFSDLQPYMRNSQLRKVTVNQVLKGGKTGKKNRAPDIGKPKKGKKGANLKQFTSLVIADNAFPGYSEPAPSGPAQENITIDSPALATTPCAGDATSEAPCSEDYPFEIQPGVNNQKVVITLVPTDAAVDYDLYVQRQDPQTGNWLTVGSSASGGAAEAVTFITPPEGSYRARIVNWSGGGPLERLDITFSNEYAGPPLYENERSAKQVKKWGVALLRYVQGGGNLVLTDGAIEALAHMGLIPRKNIRTFTQYAGYIGFTADAGNTDTYNDPLAKEIDQPGAAEGSEHRHQTYEPVPIGFPIQDENAADYNGSFVTTIDQSEWQKRGGRTVGTTTAQQVSLGELPVGKGQVRVIGALIPMPFEGAYHPFGLASYSVTYTGYQLLNNALQAGLADCVRLANLQGYNVVYGSDERDLMLGTSGNDGLCGAGGNDRIKGVDGNDVLIGGSKNDRVTGGTGNDRIYLGAGNDRGLGGKGNDRIVGFTGSDRLGGSGGKDNLNGQGGRDSCKGGPGPDKIKKCERGSR